MPITAHARSIGLWILFGLQLFCALFFLTDAAGDLTGLDQPMTLAWDDVLEGLVVVVLLAGLAALALRLHGMVRRQRRMEMQIQAASGAFAELLEHSFAAWRLTPSECDVALLTIKGLSIAEISAARQTKEGTIKAQSNAIYRKAGVTGRVQLLSLFIDGLMGENLMLRRPIEPLPVGDGAFAGRPGSSSDDG